ncbi:MAG: hypothetical protein JXD21_04650 [Candidatus Omnitrophica bacterium]|nr:hypothetical protein [Candidatus Omnitrophota bacterium]
MKYAKSYAMDLIAETKQSSLLFLDKVYQGDGFFAYSLEYDRYSKDSNWWGLANTVFAVKTYHILRSLTSLDEQRKKDIVDFMQSFHRGGGVYSDKLVCRETRLYNKLAAIKHFNFSNFFGQKTVIAETRQAVAALFISGSRPVEMFDDIPYTVRDVDKYFNSLNWRNIWGAASHVGHLVFFYKMNADLFGHNKGLNQELIAYCLHKLTILQNPKDGLWYKQEVSAKQKINAAMKIISAFNIADKKDIPYAEKIIDFMLSLKDDYYRNGDGCDNLNSMFVMKYALDSAGPNYKENNVHDFCWNALDRYKTYAYPEEGGFTFLRNAGPRKWYGMEITKKFSGPDIQGTFMFTWAISLAAFLLKINWEEFQEIIN